MAVRSVPIPSRTKWGYSRCGYAPLCFVENEEVYFCTFQSRSSLLSVAHKSASPPLHRGGLSLHSFAENLLKVTLHRMHCYMKAIFKRDRIFGRNVTDSQSRHWLSCKSYDTEPDINVTQGKRRRADVQGILSLRTNCLIVERAPYTSVHDP